jgi:hypothetical protein
VLALPARLAVLCGRRDSRHCRERRNCTFLVIVRGAAALLPGGAEILRPGLLPAAAATLLLCATTLAWSDLNLSASRAQGGSTSRPSRVPIHARRLLDHDLTSSRYLSPGKSVVRQASCPQMFADQRRS